MFIHLLRNAGKQAASRMIDKRETLSLATEKTQDVHFKAGSVTVQILIRRLQSEYAMQKIWEDIEVAYNPDSFAHKAERKGVELLVDAAIKHTNKDRQKAMMQFIDLAQKFIGDTWDPAAYDRMRDAIATTDTKWYKYISGLFDDITPKQMKALAVNVGYEAGIRGYKQTRQMAEKYNCNVPWVILMDPTSACKS